MQCLPRSAIRAFPLLQSLGIDSMCCIDFLGLEVLISSKLKDDHEEAVESAEFATEYVLLQQGRNKQTNNFKKRLTHHIYYIRILIFLFIFFVLFCSVWFGFEMEFFCIVLAVLELSLQTILALNSQRSACFCLPNTAIKGVHHHWPAGYIHVTFQILCFKLLFQEASQDVRCVACTVHSLKYTVLWFFCGVNWLYDHGVVLKFPHHPESFLVPITVI